MIVPNAAAACPYRVGDYLYTENPTHPSTSWPGTSWVQVQGRTILGAGEDYPVGSEGGEAEHTLTQPEMPRHYHRTLAPNKNNTNDKTTSSGAVLPSVDWEDSAGVGVASDPMADTDIIPEGCYSGGGQPHNNLMPYRAAYIWRRTA